MRFEALGERDTIAVHEAALAVLEETGLQVPAASDAAERLRGKGLRIAADGRLRLPRTAVEEALRSAPRVVRLAARDPKRTCVLDGRRMYVTTDGCGSRTIDIDSGERRPSTLADVGAAARLTDALDRFDVFWMMVSAQDVPLPERVAREFLTAVRHTVKHVQMIDVSRPEEAARLVRMARRLNDAGAYEGPPISVLISIVSPLRLDPGGLEAAIAFAAAGLPIACCSMPIASVTAPATPAGTVVMAHAEVIGFATVLQLLHPGAPLIYCSFPAFADARTGVANYRDPRRFWAAAAATRMGQSLRLPTLTSGELSSMLARTDLVCFGGLLEVSTLLSFEQMVIDDELLRDWLIAAADPEVDAEALAAEVIREVGPGGHYLTRPHTLRHIREIVTPKYADAERPVEKAGGPGSEETGRQRALREARRLLQAHQAPPLPEAVDRDLETLVADRVGAAG